MIDGVFVSRLQFGLTLAFHYIFVPLTIGLSVALVVLEGLLYVVRGSERYRRLTKFLAGIFAFLLESGLLGIVLFGWDRVGRGVHYLATILLSLGSHFTAIWILHPADIKRDAHYGRHRVAAGDRLSRSALPGFSRQNCA